MASARAILQKQYKLCERCNERQSVGNAKAEGVCHICRGLMERLDFIASKIIDAVEGYEFESFLIGASLPTGIYEREDSMRARLKIRGKESVKNQLTRELGIPF